MYVGKDCGTTSGACKRLKLPLVVQTDAEFVSGLVDNSDSPSFWLPSLVLQRHVMKETEWRALYEKVIK